MSIVAEGEMKKSLIKRSTSAWRLSIYWKLYNQFEKKVINGLEDAKPLKRNALM